MQFVAAVSGRAIIRMSVSGRTSSSPDESVTESNSPESSVHVVFIPVILSGTTLLILTATDLPISPVPRMVLRLPLTDFIAYALNHSFDAITDWYSGRQRSMARVTITTCSDIVVPYAPEELDSITPLFTKASDLVK